MQPDVGPSYLHTTFHPRKKVVWRWALQQIEVFLIKKRRKVSCANQKHFFGILLKIIILRGMLGSSKLEKHARKIFQFVQISWHTIGSQTKSCKDLFSTYEKSTYHKPICIMYFSMVIKSRIANTFI